MANEITMTVNFSLTNGNLSFAYQPGQLSVDQSASGGPTPGFLTIGTSEETEAFSELSTLGYCIIRNLDTTNFIRVGFATGVYGMRLKAGEIALFRLNPSTTLYMIADTAACKVLVHAFED